MASRNSSVIFDLLARDVNVKKTIDGIDKKSKNFIGTLGKIAGAFGVAFSIGAVVNGVKDVVGAYADAAAQQGKLADAFTRFPALADTNIKALQTLNTELEHKSRFDDDAIAAGQATLAQFGLTGAQLKKLSPLLVDYAAKTGKDLPSAAQDLGKAILGQGRALKGIGVNFKDTGTAAGNFQELVDELGSHVSGFAQKDIADNADAKLLNLQNRFGDIEEKIGGALMPALDDLASFTETDVLPALDDFANWFTGSGVPALEGFFGWVDKYSGVLGPAAIAIGVLTAAQWGLNVAMDANPVGAVILGLEALIALGAILATNYGGISTTIMGFEYSLWMGAIGIARSIGNVFSGLVNGAIDAINTLEGPMNALRQAAGLPTVKIGHVAIGDAIGDRAQAQLNSSYTAGMLFFNGAPTTSSRGTAGGGAGNAGARSAIGFADGGIVSAATLALIGEAGESEVVAPLSKLPALMAQAGLAGSAGGTGGQFTGTLVLDSGELMGVIRGEIQSADMGDVRISKMGKQK